MRRPACILSLVSLCVLGTSGCGGSTHVATGDARSTLTTVASKSPSPAALEEGVREAVVEDHELLVLALTRNRVPANPQGTAGPALANIRQSVAQRRKQGVTVRMLSDEFRVLSLRLEPSYTTATATVLDIQHVQPSRRRVAGKVAVFHDHARLQLRRLGDTLRFVVWKVELV